MAIVVALSREQFAALQKIQVDETAYCAALRKAQAQAAVVREQRLAATRKEAVQIIMGAPGCYLEPVSGKLYCRWEVDALADRIALALVAADELGRLHTEFAQRYADKEPDPSEEGGYLIPAHLAAGVLELLRTASKPAPAVERQYNLPPALTLAEPANLQLVPGYMAGTKVFGIAGERIAAGQCIRQDPINGMYWLTHEAGIMAREDLRPGQEFCVGVGGSDLRPVNVVAPDYPSLLEQADPPPDPVTLPRGGFF